MRVASYVLLALVSIFLINAGASFAIPGYRESLRGVKSHITGQKTVEQISAERTAEGKRLADSLDRLDAGLRSIASSAASGTTTPATSPVVVVMASWSTASGVTLSGATMVTSVTPAPVTVAPREIPVSGVLLARLMPDIMLKKIENSGIFGIVIFTRLEYSTYTDDRKRVKVYAFDEDYETILSNMKLASNVYTINETDQFFGYTFFLNPTKNDSTVRFVTSLEWHAIGIETTKSYYPTLKKILLKP